MKRGIALLTFAIGPALLPAFAASPGEPSNQLIQAVDALQP